MSMRVVSLWSGSSRPGFRQQWSIENPLLSLKSDVLHNEMLFTIRRNYVQNPKLENLVRRIQLRLDPLWRTFCYESNDTKTVFERSAVVFPWTILVPFFATRYLFLPRNNYSNATTTQFSSKLDNSSSKRSVFQSHVERLRSSVQSSLAACFFLE